MKIGVPKEIKVLEYRVGMVPAGVRELVHDGHEVIVETEAGLGIGMTDADYQKAGATVVDTAKGVFDAADLIVKVKEPQLPECAMLRDDQVLFTYLHLAADPEQAAALVNSGTTAIAYETVTADDGSFAAVDANERGGRPLVDSGWARSRCRKRTAVAVCCWAVCPALCRVTSWSSVAAWPAPMRRRWRLV